MSWDNNKSTVYRTDKDTGYAPIISSTEFTDSFSEAHVVGAYKDYLKQFAEGFEEAVEECDDRDIWHVRYFEGCIEAIWGLTANRNHRNFSSLAQDCDFRLSEIDQDARSIADSNLYWRRYFDGMVQTLTEIKKQSEQWETVMQNKKDNNDG